MVKTATYLGVPVLSFRWATLLALALGPSEAAGQASLSGTVYDSVARSPLKGALVQLVHVDSLGGQTVVADSLGRFEMRAVAPGAYQLGFIHPMLDSLGLEPIIRSVRIVGEGPTIAALAIPSAATLRTTMCGPLPPGKAAVTGFVRDATDNAPVAGAAVAADWLEMTFQKGAIMRVIPRSDAVSAANGWFVLCNVPSDGIMGLFATRGADTTDVLDVHVPETGLLRHDLYIGARTGGKLAGTVVSAINGDRLGNAQVSISGRAPIRADSRGEWNLADLPLGTRLIEVKAVGFYPERRAVNVVADGPPVRIALSSLRAVLDTVRIRAARIQERRTTGFEDRRRTGSGLYVTAQDIARKRPHNTADIFQGLRGIRIGLASDTLQSDRMGLVDSELLKANTKQILMRGIGGDLCTPAFFLNGIFVDRIDADDIDAWVTPREISGIEIYSEASVPAEFQRIGKGCGSIVFWTKR
jgi:hypothetical protein